MTIGSLSHPSVAVTEANHAPMVVEVVDKPRHAIGKSDVVATTGTTALLVPSQFSVTFVVLPHSSVAVQCPKVALFAQMLL